MNLYNEIEPYAAEWLRNLCAKGHIVNGAVGTVLEYRDGKFAARSI